MIKYALLGLLREQPDYGYRLKLRFEQHLGAVWQLNTGQIYQTLRSLKRSGLVVEVAVDDPAEEADPHRPRIFFALTPKGVRVLDRWLQRPPARSRVARDETLLRLLVLHPERRAEAIEQIQKLCHVYKKHVANLLGRKRRRIDAGAHERLLNDVALEAALLHTEAHLKWLEYVERSLLEQAEAEPESDT